MLTWATAAGHPDRANEDFAGAVPGAVVLVDGAGITGAEELCRHGTAWYAQRLGTTILARLSLDPSDLLTDAVGRSIDDVTGLHRDTCRVTDPSSPCATVAVVRVAGGRVDHLLLGDSVVVLHVRDGPPYIVEDRREPEIARPLWEALVGLEPGTAEHEQALDHARGTFRASRNQPGGFWVAKDDGRVAGEALTGSHAEEQLRGVAVLSNGASRVVDRFGLLEWADLAAADPAVLLRMVRRAEAAERVNADDATAVCWQWS